MIHKTNSVQTATAAQDTARPMIHRMNSTTNAQSHAMRPTPQVSVLWKAPPARRMPVPAVQRLPW